MVVKVVHRVVFFIYSGSLLRVSGQQDLLGAVTQVDCELAHFGEVPVDFLGHRVHWVAAPGDLGHVQCQGAHSVQVGGDLQGADDGA